MQPEAMALDASAGAEPDGGVTGLSADSSLVIRAKAGEAQAFDALMLRYQRQVLGTALRRRIGRDRQLLPRKRPE